MARALLEWYRRHRRDLPWRRQTSPYHVWISEIMLQQTQVETAIPYFERFVRRFPDVHALAAAPEEEVLKLWEGLGYYSRARHLHAAAREVVERHGGRLPRSPAELVRLPGIGRYTAGAIASIAYGEPAAAVDGNVLRVVARLACEREAVTAARVHRRIERWVERLIPAGAASDFNQALMELGALVCTPGPPRCTECPLRRWCRGAAAGEAARLPVKAARTPPRPVDVAAVWLEEAGQVLVVQRPTGGLLGGLWEFPSAERSEGEPWEAAAVRAGRERAGVAVEIVRPLAQVVHTFTHRRWDLRLYAARLATPAPQAPAPGARWIARAELGALPLPKACHKLLAAMDRSGVQLELPLV
ncbi:MAG TPA: A/G-specific adenine glycosylase, partial [Limnochordia bacterium]